MNLKEKDFDTLVEAHKYLLDIGYSAEFNAADTAFTEVNSKKTYNPKELTIDGSYRFEGQTNPGDTVEIYAIQASDGVKGTLIVSYGADQSQNGELIRQLTFS